ncbi:hypothetical protein SAMN04489761_2469 [Tenacibaculum sp. MAR_2009_124]|uniref:tetratricopeptide repeat protein n=1 Tax=Tenacibaculum sp. MAR_2009_124 TaxID=1250059 RepID=UPI0008993C6D|nr:hypothetical protein [Tenacibaculum sp. MAR_2009_124]SEC24369.1 hypothetical protein SAMN04489761_2469 [Tenacibaculum sp. MAR_2009_124]
MGKDEKSIKNLIDKFLNDKIEDSDREELSSLNEDEGFIDALTETSVKEMGRYNLKQKLEGIGNMERKKRKRSKIVKMFLTTSSVAAVIFLGTFRFMTSSNSTLFESNFSPYPNVYAVKGEDNKTNDLLKEAMGYYDNEQYEEAILKFRELSEKELSGFPGLYYGISLLMVNNIEESKSVFRNINSKETSSIEAQWYLGLTYLKQDSLNKAKEIFELSKDSHGRNRKKQIDEILKKID